MGRLLALAAVGLLVPFRSPAQSITQEEALRLAFPAPAVVERATAFLSEEQAAEAARLARASDRGQRIVTYYVGAVDGRPLGVAYFDAHVVRTLPEVLMVVVTPDDTIERIEILRFSEPPDYRAPSGWLGTFRRRELNDALSLRGDIANITGATLTARAVTAASRRVLALHAVIRPLGAARVRSVAQ